MTSAFSRGNWLDHAAVVSIEAYQRHLSPLKGFACAHRVLHGGRSCSEFARKVVRRGGVGALMELLPQRFDRCAAAADVLKARRVLGHESNQRRDSQQSSCTTNCLDSSWNLPVHCLSDFGSAGCDVWTQ